MLWEVKFEQKIFLFFSLQNLTAQLRARKIDTDLNGLSMQSMVITVISVKQKVPALYRFETDAIIKEKRSGKITGSRRMRKMRRKSIWDDHQQREAMRQIKTEVNDIQG